MPEWEEITEAPFPRHDLEIPVVGRTWLLEETRRPQSELQALMETEPNHPPDWSDPTPEGERVAWLMLNELNEDERAVLEVTVIAGHSIRKAADILGLPKSSVHRIKVSALARIKALLETETETDES